MTPIDRAVNTHSRALLLGFAAVVCVATGATLFLSSAPELDCTRSATIRQKQLEKQQQQQKRLEEEEEEASWPSNPNDWSLEQIHAWLLRVCWNK